MAMTRAKDHLHVIVPQRFYVSGQQARGDRHVYAARTRFIPDHILDRFDQYFWPPPTSEASSTHQPDIRLNIKARMRGMWT